MWGRLIWFGIPTLGGFFKDVNGCSASIKGEEFFDYEVGRCFIKLLIKHKFKLNSDNTHEVKEHETATVEYITSRSNLQLRRLMKG